jgi:hypothetical protein
VAQAETLQYLGLSAKGNLRTMEVDKDSTDPDFDGTESIMRTLHSQKFGKPFVTIEIHLLSATQPSNWRPAPNGTGYGSWWTFQRYFASRVNGAGKYEQWGADRGGEIPGESTGSLEIEGGDGGDHVS